MRPSSQSHAVCLLYYTPVSSFSQSCQYACTNLVVVAVQQSPLLPLMQIERCCLRSRVGERMALPRRTDRTQEVLPSLHYHCVHLQSSTSSSCLCASSTTCCPLKVYSVMDTRRYRPMKQNETGIYYDCHHILSTVNSCCHHILSSDGQQHLCPGCSLG